MALSDLNDINGKVRFEVYAQELGSNFNGVTVAATHSYSSALRTGLLDIDAMHQLIYNRLPNTVPNDPKKYNYIEIIGLDSSLKIIGIPWIKESSIAKVTQMFYIPRILINSTADVSIIRQVLNQAGYDTIANDDIESL